MFDQALPFVLGFTAGLVVGLILHNVLLVKTIKASKDKEAVDDDDWWKRGEPPPWNKE